MERLRELDQEEEEASETEMPPMCRVVALNNDYTPRSFVEELFMKFFGYTSWSASDKTAQIEASGSGIVGVYPRPVAEEKVKAADDYQRSSGVVVPVELRVEDA